MKNLVNVIDNLSEETAISKTRRIANIERTKYGSPKKVRIENDHTDHGHTRRNIRGEKGRQW